MLHLVPPRKILIKLAFALDIACPDDLHVFPAPFAVRPSSSTELRPDVLVARHEDLTEKLLPKTPVLAVEVFSPSERMEVPSYWVVDPQQPSITVFELVDGKYQLVTEVKDTAVLEVTRPFPVRVVPRSCLARWRPDFPFVQASGVTVTT